MENLTKSFNDTKLAYNTASLFEYRTDSGLINSSSNFIYYKKFILIEAQQDLNNDIAQLRKNHTHAQFVEDVSEFNEGKSTSN